MHENAKWLGVLLLLAAPCIEACRHMPEPALVCGYIPKEPSADNPYAELSPQGNCGERTEDGLTLAPEHLAALSFGPEGLGWVYTRDGVFYVKPSGKTVETLWIDNGPDFFVAGLARGVVRGKVGFIDRDLEFAIAPAYDFASPFYDGRHAWVCNGCASVPIHADDEHHEMAGGRWGVIDRSGRIVVPVEQSKEALNSSPESWNAPPTEPGWRP